jgi:hypothetical protein
MDAIDLEQQHTGMGQAAGGDVLHDGPALDHPEQFLQ